ncbi:phage integrase N-terminal SAM-like domain-containing protein [Bacillus cereus group sp. BfR-BA-02675]|uniref:tyrosine-type recombinase/integrase n=1 Tax=Bacillus cereus group TaxID=86661 RepID=UPI000BBA082E|nr:MULTISPECIES: site-specific integrase [Bacillus cereus group]PCC77290.1 integrase [Bacillus cereus]MCC2475779.1 phage integrase N-terminal SAM-like domain-containing protein [Bacillus paranthracis]MDX5768588.1 phage integrase N-terminal SAM-like domain-containing protein [Bacillus cereus group sp. BfR-BA-02675]MDX5891510.1 phage integrase N-terminal SAM-like domain-containing protein [Bacillus cereus group sp. BfR-BA-01039]PDR74694.1 integrase [Bacillus cereus]
MQGIQDTIKGFSSYLLNKGRKPSTVKRYIYDIEDFIKWLHLSKRFNKNDVWESLHKKDFEAFFTYLKDDRQYSDKTTHRIYVVLNRLYDYLDLPSPIEAVIHIEQPDRKLREEDFISFDEEKRLKEVTASLEGLTEKQRSVRPMILERNMSIISLLLDYGLSLQELGSLQMQHVHFESNTLSIPEDSKINRIVHLEEKHKLYLYNYYKTIPEPVRPRYHSSDPLFVAFDFTRGTYHWSYNDDAPKFLTEISIQKMIRLEVKRANLRKGIAAQHFRNTYILKQIQKKTHPEKIMQQVGFKSNLSLKRYYDYYQHSGSNIE